ncbi:MAG: hypothetical protein MRY78_10940 [Saprospiraceae bacterium]|nr:hypothetical protein [Saprospiraceae bacterium]
MRYLPLIAVVILFLSGCQLESLNDPVLVTDVEDEFYVDMWESLSPSQRTLSFRIRTIENEPCLNSTVNAAFAKFGNELTLELNGINEADCVPGDGPARSEEFAGSLNSGLYKFNLNLQNTVFNAGQLEINQSRYFLDFETENGFNLLHSILLRVPEKSFWGYIDYASNPSAAAQLADNIASRGLPLTLSRGYYGHFTIDDSVNGIQVTNMPVGDEVLPFIWEYTEGSKAEIQNLIANFRNAHPEATIMVFDDLGQTW